MSNNKGNSDPSFGKQHSSKESHEKFFDSSSLDQEDLHIPKLSAQSVVPEVVFGPP